MPDFICKSDYTQTGWVLVTVLNGAFPIAPDEMIYYVQTRKGVLDIANKKIIPDGAVTGKCKNTPHGFVNGHRVWGFHKALERGAIHLTPGEWVESVSDPLDGCFMYSKVVVVEPRPARSEPIHISKADRSYDHLNRF